MITINLAGKTAIVTGSSQGLGAITAQVLHIAGAQVVVNYFNDAGGVNKANADKVVANLGDGAIAIEADVRNEQSVKAMIDKTIERFGRLDIVINNAGIIRDKTIKKMTTEEWQSVLDTNLTGPFNVCRAAAEKLSEGGRIVNFDASVKSI